MATMTLTVGANTKNWTISAGDVTRVLAAVRLEVGQINDTTVSPPVMRDLTNAEVFDIIASRFVTNLKEMVKNAERIATPIPDVVLT